MRKTSFSRRRLSGVSPLMKGRRRAASEEGHGEISVFLICDIINIARANRQPYPCGAHGRQLCECRTLGRGRRAKLRAMTRVTRSCSALLRIEGPQCRSSDNQCQKRSFVHLAHQTRAWHQPLYKHRPCPGSKLSTIIRGLYNRQ